VRAALTYPSGNEKTGPIAVSTTSSDTCPDACPLRKNGCYAEGYPLRQHWTRLDRGEWGGNWPDFLDRVRKLPKGVMFRHNQAGDLPGVGDAVNATALASLVSACAQRGLRAFTYTHKPVGWGSIEHVINMRAIHAANANGLTVNLSADTLAEADELSALGCGPVVTILPCDASDRPTKTPGGRTVVVCPAQTKAALTCAECGLCAVAKRKAIVGFKSHGVFRKRAERVALTVIK